MMTTLSALEHLVGRRFVTVMGRKYRVLNRTKTKIFLILFSGENHISLPIRKIE